MTLIVTAASALASCGPDYSGVANLDSTGTTIVCLGDSITNGYGVSDDQSYPSLLADAVSLPVINAGVNGDTTGGALARFQRDVLRHDPKVVIVNLGGNDFIQRLPEEQVYNNLDRIVSGCVDNGAMVMVVHAKFGLFSDPYRKGYKNVAEKHGAVFVADVLDDILGNPKNMYDQIHPNARGHRLIAQRIAEVLVPLLEAAAEA